MDASGFLCARHPVQVCILYSAFGKPLYNYLEFFLCILQDIEVWALSKFLIVHVILFKLNAGSLVFIARGAIFLRNAHYDGILLEPCILEGGGE